MIKNISNFFREVNAEMHKVTWPTREELIGSTSVVLITMFILSAFIGTADFLMSHLIKIILHS